MAKIKKITKNILSIDNVTKVYQDSGKGISDVTININAGSCHAILGHNGAGKTTLIKCIVGLHKFNTGSIKLQDIDVSIDPILVKEKIHYIPDEPTFFEFLTGIQYLDFICNVYNVDKEQRQERIEKISNLLGLTNDLSNRISSYSHGMKQKLSFIAAFVHDPVMIIMDEPFVGLDPLAASSIKLLITDFCAKGNAIFFSSHVLEIVEKICDSITVLKEGKVITSGSKKDVLKTTKSLEDLYLKLYAK